jgi:hypothetical protein
MLNLMELATSKILATIPVIYRLTKRLLLIIGKVKMNLSTLTSIYVQLLEGSIADYKKKIGSDLNTVNLKTAFMRMAYKKISDQYNYINLFSQLLTHLVTQNDQRRTFSVCF